MLPVALASDSFGNVFVGDHNFIRKIDVNGTASSLYTTRSAPAKVRLKTFISIAIGLSLIKLSKV